MKFISNISSKMLLVKCLKTPVEGIKCVIFQNQLKDFDKSLAKYEQFVIEIDIFKYPGQQRDL